MPAVRMPNTVRIQYVGGLSLQETKKKKPPMTFFWISTANDKFWGGFWQIVIIILIKTGDV